MQQDQIISTDEEMPSLSRVEKYGKKNKRKKKHGNKNKVPAEYIITYVILWTFVFFVGGILIFVFTMK